MRMRWPSLLLLSWCAAGCRGPWDEMAFIDEGDVCFQQRDHDLAISVTAPECLSSSCTRRVEVSCTATIDGDRIELHSELRWEEKEGRAITGGCTEDCQSAFAECFVFGPTPGNYTVVHGEEELPLTIPVTEPCPI